MHPLCSTSRSHLPWLKLPGSRTRHRRSPTAVPLNSLAMLLYLIWRQTSNNCSLVKLPLCLMFLVFLRSLSGSLSCLMMRLVAFGSTSTLAARFWIVSRTVTRMPFQAAVPLTMSSPTFLGDMPRGPTFGARTDEGACSPPYWRSFTTLTSLGSNLGAISQHNNTLRGGQQRIPAVFLS